MSTSQRQRIEDLGRLSVLLDDLLEDNLFDNVPHSAKRFPEWFWSIKQEDQRDCINSLGYAIVRVKEEISKCLDIAEGKDSLNENSTNIVEEMKKFMQGFAYKPPQEKEQGEYEP